MKILKYFFYVLFFTFFLLVGDGFLQYLTGKNILGFEIVEANRISSFFHDELILGSYLSRLLPLLFGLFILLKFSLNRKVQILIFPLFILTEVLVFLSGERTSFFFINLSAILHNYFFKNFKN